MYVKGSWDGQVFTRTLSNYYHVLSHVVTWQTRTLSNYYHVLSHVVAWQTGQRMTSVEQIYCSVSKQLQEQEWDWTEMTWDTNCLWLAKSINISQNPTNNGHYHLHEFTHLFCTNRTIINNSRKSSNWPWQSYSLPCWLFVFVSGIKSTCLHGRFTIPHSLAFNGWQ